MNELPIPVGLGPWMDEFTDDSDVITARVSWSPTKDIISMRNYITQALTRNDEFNVLWNERNKHLRYLGIVKIGGAMLFAKHIDSITPSFIGLAISLHLNPIESKELNISMSELMLTGNPEAFMQWAYVKGYRCGK
jgi:hypothetical protein